MEFDSPGTYGHTDNDAPGLEHDEQSAAYAEAVNAGNPPHRPQAGGR